MSRTVGTLGISVGTSSAFEGEAMTLVKSMDNVLINFRTLVRNAIESYATEDKLDVTTLVGNVKDDLIGILKFIDSRKGQRQVLVEVYNPSYQSRERKFKHALLKTPRTDKQKAREALTKSIITQFEKENKGILKSTDCELKVFSGRALILTHHVMDLTFTNATTRLTLLESYTGYAKTYLTWNTKLTNGTELHNIPFNRLTLQVYGDKGTDFFSHNLGVKALVNQLAINCRWTTNTTYEKVKNDIRGLPKSVDRDGLMLMF